MINTAANQEKVVVLRDYLRQVLRLPEAAALLENAPVLIPDDPGLHVRVAVIGSRTFGSTQRYVDVDGVCMCEQAMPTHELIQVDLFSHNGDARRRRADVLFALNSPDAEALQLRYAFKLAIVPQGFVDASEGEGGGRLNRYICTVPIIYTQYRRTPVPTFERAAPALLVNP